ncbi:recombinase family protein [Sphingomonas faeni]|uniref:recombinase family protein n=1 Tax=Sphingomonas faeni TaxID=185950 RepID=UPI0033528574
MSEIAYLRVSTSSQTIAAQRSALSGPLNKAFDKEFVDEGVSGAIQAERRPGFASMLEYVREGDTLHVYAIDRLGRDALDIQHVVRKLIGMGVAVEVHGLGRIARGVGEVIVAVLAQIAQIERDAIAERTAAGRALAKASLAVTGRTHRGKASLGRPPKLDAAAVQAWRAANGKSVSQTARHFAISESTVKRYSASQAYAADHADIRQDRSDEGLPRPTVPFEVAAKPRIDGDTLTSDNTGRAIGTGLPHMPVPVSTTEDVGERDVPLQLRDDIAEPFFGEVDVPLPLGLDDRPPVGGLQGREQIAQLSVAIRGRNVKPRLPVRPKHRRTDDGLVRKRGDGTSPVGSVGGIDDEPMLPFDDTQGGFGEQGSS